MARVGIRTGDLCRPGGGGARRVPVFSDRHARGTADTVGAAHVHLPQESGAVAEGVGGPEYGAHQQPHFQRHGKPSSDLPKLPHVLVGPAPHHHRHRHALPGEPTNPTTVCYSNSTSDYVLSSRVPIGSNMRLSGPLSLICKGSVCPLFSPCSSHPPPHTALPTLPHLRRAATGRRRVRGGGDPRPGDPAPVPVRDARG